MKNCLRILMVVVALILGYFSYPKINPSKPTQLNSLNYEQLVQQVSQKAQNLSPEDHDDLLMKEIFEANDQMRLNENLQEAELLRQQAIRERALFKAALTYLKTPEAQQALLNLADRKTQ